jgi:hypothetical protein
MHLHAQASAPSHNRASIEMINMVTCVVEASKSALLRARQASAHEVGAVAEVAKPIEHSMKQPRPSIYAQLQEHHI